MAIKVAFCDIGNTLIHKKQWLPGAKEFLKSLREKKTRIGVISNTGNLDREQLTRLLPEDFDFGVFDEGLVLLSSETGMEKPGLGVFLLAIQHAGVSPWETLFVGESLNETMAAQRAGMQAARIIDAKSDFAKLTECL